MQHSNKPIGSLCADLSINESYVLGPLVDCNKASLFNPATLESPLAINFYFPDMAIANYPQLLMDELTLYLQKLVPSTPTASTVRPTQHRTVKTWLRGRPFKALSPGDITEIAFLTATSLYLEEGSEYGFECTMDEVDHKYLGLMKGLRFTTLLLNIDATHVPKTQSLRPVLDDIKQYDFKEVHFRLDVQHSDSSTLFHWLESLMENKPHLIELVGIHGMEEPLNLDQLTRRMATIGYKLIGDRFFMIDHHPLLQQETTEELQYTPWGPSQPMLTHWIGLGIGALGKLGHGFYQNTSDQSDYESRLSEGELPIQCSGKYSNEKTTKAWAVIEQLICHHRIEQAKARTLKENPILSEVFQQACNKGWMVQDGKYLNLSGQGLNHLHELCQDLRLS